MRNSILSVMFMLFSFSTFAQDETVQLLTANSLEMIKERDPSKTNIVSYNYGVALGYFVSGRNELVSEYSLDLLNAHEFLDLNEPPTIEHAIQALKSHTKLNDKQFCLFKGLARGYFFASNENTNVIFAAITDERRYKEVCTKDLIVINKKAINNDSRNDIKNVKTRKQLRKERRALAREQ